VEIAKASVEQSQGLEQITKAMTEMDRVTQANAATAEESASVAHELSTQSVQLGAAVHQLNAFSGIDSRVNDTTPIRPHLATPAAKLAAKPLTRTQAGVAKAGSAAGAGKADENFWR